mgnify:FL=1
MQKVMHSKEDAGLLTEEIKRATARAWELLEKAHEGQAWVPMGYHSWSEYVTNELGISRSHSFRLLDQAAVIRAFEKISPQLGTPEISEWQARRIKPYLPETLERARELLNDGKEPAEAIQGALAEREEIYKQAAVIAYSDPLLDLEPALAAIEKMQQKWVLEEIPGKIAAIHDWQRVRYYGDRLAQDIEYLMELREVMQGHLARSLL